MIFKKKHFSRVGGKKKSGEVANFGFNFSVDCKQNHENLTKRQGQATNDGYNESHETCNGLLHFSFRTNILKAFAKISSEPVYIILIDNIRWQKKTDS